MLFSFLTVLSLIFSPVSSFLFSDFAKSPYITRAGNVDTIKYVPSSTGTPVLFSLKAIQPPKREATMQYDILFKKGFEWVKGGKLPGFLGGPKDVKTYGCVVPQPINAWSLRLMWTNKGGIQLYKYDQDRRTNGARCGTVVYSRSFLQTEKWYRFKLYMKVNSHANARDGSARFYVNNSLLLESKNIPWRGVNDSALIDWIFFTTFYGGHDKTWSPSKTTYAQIKNVAVW
jgi:hypothetical protein